MAGKFNHKFKEAYKSEMCVVKFWFGTKYMFWKCLRLYPSCEQVFRDLNRKIFKDDLPETDLFYKAAKYCRRARVMIATVEVVCATDDLLMIRAIEQELLTKHFDDPNCLNITKSQYVPKWLMTPNEIKALQSTISTTDDQMLVKKELINPGARKDALLPKQSENASPVFDAARIVRQINALKSKK